MTNISQQKRQKMLDFLAKLKQDHQDDDILRAIGEIETALNEKKYGLVWEKHTEKVDEMLEHNIPVFCEDDSRKIVVDENAGYNFLLEGDNLHSLKLLEKTHKGKIDVIYIDPPYNTGNKDFIYNDSFVDKTDGYSHSKWLSFMSERLEIARELLSDEGVIFISIDDNEQAQLKLLCDEIFGAENFVGNICRATGTTTGQDANKIGSSLDYCLVYRKTNLFNLKGIPLKGDDLKRFNLEDKKGKYSILQLRKTGNEDRKEDRPNMFYPIIAPNGEEVYPFGPNKYLSRWRVSRDSFCELNNNNMIEWKENKKHENIEIDGYKNSKWTPYVKYYLEGRTKQVSNLWLDIEGNKKASIDLKNILGEKLFNYPKPLEFLTQILLISSQKYSTILDFFAGSGTTGHAVMQLNKEDGGNRKYILCTNNENNICEEVTYQRLKNIQEELPHNLKYFKTDFISKYESDEDDETIYEKMLEHIKELIELEHHIEIDDEKYIILDDEDELETIIENIKDDGKLFITSGIFLTRTHQRILDDKRVSVIDIPEYYYRSELKEIGEL